MRGNGPKGNEMIERNLLFALITLVALSVGASAQKANKDLADLAATERAFAATAVKEGFRDSFIKFFADDGIGFGPHPERTRGKLMQSPPATAPRRVIFNWSPMFGDISDAGDLGYSTGPLLYTEITEKPRPSWHGTYFSVWQKQADGTWKVAIDMGVDTPAAVAPLDTKFTAATLVKRTGKNPMKGTASDDYRQLDWNLWGLIAKGSPIKGYSSYLDTEFRVHRKGMMPLTTQAGLASVVKQTKFEFIDGKIASSNDLAFTYGKYSTVNEPDAETGYYVHVWRRDANDQWRLVTDVQNPLPKSEK